MRAISASGPNVARYACFAAFMSTLFIYSPNVMTLFAFDAAEYTGSFAEPCLIATLVSACALLVAQLAGISKGIERVFSSHVFKITCIGAYVACCLLFVTCILMQLPGLAQHLGVVGVVCGISLMGVSLLWAEAFRDIDLFGAMLAVIGALLLSATLHALSGLCSWRVLFGCEVLLLLTGSLSLLYFLRQLPNSDSSEHACNALPEEVQQKADSPLALIANKGRAFASVMGIPLVGMAISSLAIGVRPFYIFDNTVSAQVISMFVAILFAIPLICLRKKQPLYVFVYQVYLPALIALATALSMVLKTGILAEIACLILCAAFTLATVIAIAASAAVSNAGEFPRALVFATLVAVYSGFGISGIRIGACSSALYDNSQAFLSLLAVLYTCGMLVFSCNKLWKSTTSNMREDGIAAINDDPAAIAEPHESFDERLERISKESGLSARETQIMSYVGKGHTSVYVAKTLLISDSTVYTHVRNIYRKLGITSREELIQLLNDKDG